MPLLYPAINNERLRKLKKNDKSINGYGSYLEMSQWLLFPFIRTCYSDFSMQAEYNNTYKGQPGSLVYWWLQTSRICTGVTGRGAVAGRSALMTTVAVAGTVAGDTCTGARDWFTVCIAGCLYGRLVFLFS